MNAINVGKMRPKSDPRTGRERENKEKREKAYNLPIPSFKKRTSQRFD
jgi:hypothetical protein